MMDEPELPQAPYPGPLSAVLLTLAAMAATLFVAALFASESLLAAMGVGQAIGVGAIASLGARRVPEPQAERLGLRGFPPSLLLPLVGLIPLVFVLSEIDNIVGGMLPPPEVSEEAADAMELLDITSFYGRLQLGIIAVGIAPVVEEWLFRGVLLQGLVSHLGRLRGVLLTACLYAPLHPFSVSAGSAFFSAVVASTVLGIVLGIVRLATGSVLAPILLTAGINGVVVLAMWFETEFSIPGFNAEGLHTPVEILLPAVLVTGYALARFVGLAQEAPVVPQAPAAEPAPDQDSE